MITHEALTWAAEAPQLHAPPPPMSDAAIARIALESIAAFLVLVGLGHSISHHQSHDKQQAVNTTFHPNPIANIASHRHLHQSGAVSPVPKREAKFKVGNAYLKEVRGIAHRSELHGQDLLPELGCRWVSEMPDYNSCVVAECSHPGLAIQGRR